MTERYNRPTRDQIRIALVDETTSSDWDRNILDRADPVDRTAVEGELGLAKEFFVQIDPKLMRRLINDIRMK